jgi:hypothetical protein
MKVITFKLRNILMMISATQLRSDHMSGTDKTTKARIRIRDICCQLCSKALDGRKYPCWQDVNLL